MDAAAWDERYRATDLVWGAPPNRWVEQELTGAAPRRALDLACGEGRNALWLAAQGWQVTAADFSPVAIGKARELDVHHRVTWQVADATAYDAPGAFDLALLCYLQLAAAERRLAVRAAAAALAPAGVLLVIAHDSRNLTEGTGGPQVAPVLYTADDIAGDLQGSGLHIDRAGEVLRPVEGADRPAIDALVKATRVTAP
jgi:SAM-dependent methyltransferase